VGEPKGAKSRLFAAWKVSQSVASDRRKEPVMTRKTCVSSIALCMILGSFMFGQAGAVEADKWPGTKVSEATPKVPGMPAVLAKNLANFDDLDFRRRCQSAAARRREEQPSQSTSIPRLEADGHERSR
jgi:hypothetical protein